MILYLHINIQIKKQKSIIKLCLKNFVNFDKNNLALILLIVKFAYNNIKNAIINFILLKLKCDYYFYVFFQKDINFFSGLIIANKLSL